MSYHLCDYGCGKEGKYKFKNGKWCCKPYSNQCPSKRSIRSIKCKEQGISPFEGRVHTTKSKNKIREANKNREPWNKGKTYEELYGYNKAKILKENHSQFMKDHPYNGKSQKGIRKHSEEFKLQQSKRMKKNNPMKKPEIVQKNVETRKRNGTTGLGIPKPEYLCKKQSERMKKNNPMKNPETVMKNFKSHNREKSGPEIYLEKVFKKLKLNIEYIGNGKMFINGKCPDFIIPHSNKLIEVYDSSFHYTGQIRDNKWIKNREKELCGYKVLFIDFNIYGKAKNFKRLCKKINVFVKGV